MRAKMTQNEDGSWDVYAGTIRLVAEESYTVAANVEYNFNNPDNCDIGECEEVVDSARERMVKVRSLWDRAVRLSKQHIATGEGILEAVFAAHDCEDEMTKVYGKHEWQSPANVATGYRR